jgi:hypothetical protein
MGEFEVPKDGKTYICWHSKHGHMFLAWQKLDRNPGYKAFGPINHPYTEVVSEMFLNGIIRYMNQSGHWVERK